MINSLDLLHKSVRPKCEDFINRCAEKGIKVKITSTLRTELDQFALYCQGRADTDVINWVRRMVGLWPLPDSSAARKVTWTQESIHMYGLAFDFAIVSNTGGLTWDLKADVNADQIPDYIQAGEIAESCGLEWGGRWQAKDYVHCEYTGGLTRDQLKTGIRPEPEA